MTRLAGYFFNGFSRFLEPFSQRLLLDKSVPLHSIYKLSSLFYESRPRCWVMLEKVIIHFEQIGGFQSELVRVGLGETSSCSTSIPLQIRKATDMDLEIKFRRMLVCYRPDNLLAGKLKCVFTCCSTRQSSTSLRTSSSKFFGPKIDCVRASSQFQRNVLILLKCVSRFQRPQRRLVFLTWL